MPGFSWGGVGQTLKSGMLGDVNYDPETMKLEQEKSNQERNLGMESRGSQAALGQALRNQMAGKGPSVAQNQMQTGREQMMRAATAASAGARGSSVAAANKQGMTAAQNIGLGVNRDAASLRAQEIQAATKMYSDQLYQQRMQDLMSRGMSIDEAKAQLDYYAKLQSIRMQGAIEEQRGAQQGVAGIMGMAAGALGAASGMETKTNVQPVGASPMPSQPIDESFRPAPARTNLISALRGSPAAGQSEAKISPQPAATEPPNKSLGVLRGALAGYASGLSNNPRVLNDTLADLRRQRAEWEASGGSINSGMETKTNVQQMGSSTPDPAADMSRLTAPQSESSWQPPQASEKRSGLEAIPVVGPMVKGFGSDDKIKNAEVLSQENAALKAALGANGGKNASALKTKAQRFPVTEEISQLPTIRFNYENNELGNFRDIYGPDKFTGTSANVMEKLPSTAPAVKRGPNGVRMVDPTVATMTNLGATAELSRRVQELEAQLAASKGSKRPSDDAVKTNKKALGSSPKSDVDEAYPMVKPSALSASLKKQPVGSTRQAVYEEGYTPPEQEELLQRGLIPKGSTPDEIERQHKIRAAFPPGLGERAPSVREDLSKIEDQIPKEGMEQYTGLPGRFYGEQRGKTPVEYRFGMPSPVYKLESSYGVPYKEPKPVSDLEMRLIHEERKSEAAHALRQALVNKSSPRRIRRLIQKFDDRARGWYLTNQPSNPEIIQQQLESRGVKMPVKQIKDALRDEVDL